MWLPIEATAKEGRKLEREHLRNARSFGTQQAEERDAQEQRKAAKLNRVLDEAKSRAKTGLKTLGIGEGECRVHVKVGRKWGEGKGGCCVHKAAWATGAVGWGWPRARQAGELGLGVCCVLWTQATWLGRGRDACKSRQAGNGLKTSACLVCLRPACNLGSVLALFPASRGALEYFSVRVRCWGS